MANKEPEYPKGMYLPGDPVPVYAHTEKEEVTMREKGRTDRIPYYEFPKCLYHETLDAIVVKDANEERLKLAEGFQLKPVARTQMLTPMPDPVALQAKLEAQEEIIKQLLAERDLKAQAEERPKKRGRIPVLQAE